MANVETRRDENTFLRSGCNMRTHFPYENQRDSWECSTCTQSSGPLVASCSSSDMPIINHHPCNLSMHREDRRSCAPPARTQHADGSPTARLRTAAADLSTADRPAASRARAARAPAGPRRKNAAKTAPFKGD